MNTIELVEWQRYSPKGLVQCWWTHPFLDLIETWDLSDKVMLETGAGLGTAWLRSKCKWVDSIEANSGWASRANKVCYENNLNNGVIYAKDLPDGVQERKKEYFDLIPHDKQYDIISVDGIWRYEMLQWALDHFKGKGGILIADNYQQDFVWICPAADELMNPYQIHRFEQPDHVNHEGRKWNTSYWEIPA